MAWERRKSGTYYYEKKRVNGKTVSIYWGNGELAREREQQIRLRRVTKRAKRVFDRERKELLHEVSSRGKEALQLLLVNVAQLYRLKGRRVPKLCAKAVKAFGPRASGPYQPKMRNLGPKSTPHANLQHNVWLGLLARECHGLPAHVSVAPITKTRNPSPKSTPPAKMQHNHGNFERAQSAPPPAGSSGQGCPRAGVRPGWPRSWESRETFCKAAYIS